MKDLKTTFTDEEHKLIFDLKKKLNCKSWHDFILLISINYKKGINKDARK